MGRDPPEIIELFIMWNNTKKILTSTKVYPIALLLLCLIGFGGLISSLGFYWDDWPSVWFLHFFGPSSFKAGFAEDRPLLAWVFMFTTSIVGESPLSWQIFAILMRWLYAVTVWWVLGMIWPRNKLQTAAIVFLLALYPGFRQQFISVTYGNAFVVFTMFTASLGAMIIAIKKNRWFFPAMLVSLFLDAVSLFISEYFFGLEFIRPLLLWLAQQDQGITGKKRIQRTALVWAPFFAIVILFGIWRVFLHQTPRADIVIFEQLRLTPVATILKTSWIIINDILQTGVFAWLATINLSQMLELEPTIISGYLAMIIISGPLVFLYLNKYGLGEEQGDPNKTMTSKAWGKQAILVGLYALIIGGIPIWVTNLKIELFFPTDRFTLTMMLGSCIFLIGLIGWITRTRQQFILIVACLASISVGMHYLNAVNFREDWIAQKSFLWQLVWRAPGIKPNTILMTSGLTFDYESDNSLTAPLNWTYAPENTSPQMSYTLLNIESRFGNLLTSYERGQNIDQPYRAAYFQGSTDQTIVFFYQPPRCLKVMDPIEDANLPYKPDYLPPSLPLSNPDLIIQNPAQSARPPRYIFGEEPIHDWCYYFEKAELASQVGAWEQIVKLATRAQPFNKDINRETASELVPFIKGYAHVGQWEQAFQLTLKSFNASPKMQNMLCTTWNIIQISTSQSPEREVTLDQIREEVGCLLP
jgi:hypothetical protein